MKAASQIELLNIFQKAFPKDEAEKIIKILVDDTQPTEELKQIFLTKDDKIEILNRIDSSFKWLAGIVIAMFSLTIAILKLL
ncbi:MAG: hypothetical protein JWQ09_26 [Segetibacter sp.]|nr:hypothetical protein [Segetibacter sp.]